MTLELIPKSQNARNYRHGYKTAGKCSTEYSIWNCMRARCGNPNNPNYLRYGARGISVCPEWQEDFLSFIRDMGRRPSMEHSLDRKDNDGDYTPENCRWATRKEQGRNKRSSRFLIIGGEAKTSAEWSDLYGIRQGTIHQRLKMGWTEEAAVTRPLRGFAGKDGKYLHEADIYQSVAPFAPEVR